MVYEERNGFIRGLVEESCVAVIGKMGGKIGINQKNIKEKGS